MFCGTYVSGVTFVSLVPVEILFGEGGGGMRVGCSQLQQQIPTFSLCFGHVSLNGVFLPFSRLGGVLTPLFGELELFYDLG